MTKITKAIIPVAGLGTRFFPATKAVSKEMLPIVDKPCIQYLVEEAVASGITEIIFVISENQTAIKNHFKTPLSLSKILKERNKKTELALLQKIDKLAKISYIYQKKPLGDGHAILCAKKLIKNEPVAILFGDDIWDYKTPPLLQLIKKFNKFSSPIIALEKIPKELTHKYGIIAKKDKNSKHFHQIKDFIEKPSPKKAPSNLAITGKYIITPKLLEHLSQAGSNTKDGELRLIDGMKSFIKENPIYGCEIEGIRFDTGDKLEYLKAVTHFTLKNKTLSPHFKKYLKGLAL